MGSMLEESENDCTKIAWYWKLMLVLFGFFLSRHFVHFCVCLQFALIEWACVHIFSIAKCSSHSGVCECNNCIGLSWKLVRFEEQIDLFHICIRPLPIKINDIGNRRVAAIIYRLGQCTCDKSTRRHAIIAQKNVYFMRGFSEKFTTSEATRHATHTTPPLNCE